MLLPIYIVYESISNEQKLSYSGSGSGNCITSFTRGKSWLGGLSWAVSITDLLFLVSRSSNKVRSVP